MRTLRFARIKGNMLPYYCPCCDAHLNDFVPGKYVNKPEVYDITRYVNINQDVVCPVCSSLPRHRILVAWLDENKELIEGKRILHFAQEHSVQLWMERTDIHATAADLLRPADLQINIEETGLESESYDIIICNHVLEHVNDFRKALKEMYRILTPGGFFICSFPMDPKVELLDEDPSINTDEERKHRFGQINHNRVFGMKANEFLKEAGFSVETINGKDYPDRILPVIGPADYDINMLFCCMKERCF